MQSRGLTLLLSLGLFSVGESTDKWDYNDIAAWPKFVDPKGAKNECTGNFQSPIDIVTEHAEENLDQEMGKLKFEEGATAESLHDAELVVNGHTWEVTFGATPAEPAAPAATERRLHEGAEGPAGETAGVWWQGTWYWLHQFHFHSPSENTVDNKYFDMEAHHVHKSAEGKYLVIAAMLKVGEENEYLKGFWSELEPVTQQTDPVKAIKISSPYTNFMPTDKSYVTFEGSFTTPPCTEGTTWIVLEHNVELSAKQLAEYRAGVNGVEDNQLTNIKNVLPDATTFAGVTEGFNTELGVNNRPVQALNGRTMRWFYEAQPKVEKEKDNSPLWIVLSVLAGLAAIGLITALVLHFMKEPPKKKRAVKKAAPPPPVEEPMVQYVTYAAPTPQPVQTMSYPVTTYAAPQTTYAPQMQYAAAPSPYIVR